MVILDGRWGPLCADAIDSLCILTLSLSAL